MPPITTPAPAPTPKPKLPHPTPLLRLYLQDLSHASTPLFLSATAPATLLKTAVTNVLNTLYPTPSLSNWPGTRSITLHLSTFPGVAYTTGKSLDNDHKEIHLSLSYLAAISPAERLRAEIEGVVVHEMVHCWQHNGQGTCPGGLIEGIADFVRLKAGYVPPHWRREASGKWDQGYQATGYFLEWLERKFGDGAVARINEGLRGKEYEEVAFWRVLFGKEVGVLWEEYGRWLRREEGGGDGDGDGDEDEDQEQESASGGETGTSSGEDG